MPFSLVPDRLFNDYEEVTPAMLQELGVTLLLSDLDFTLAPKSTRRPDERLKNYIAQLKLAGIDFMIVSNNRSGRRVADFCDELNISYQGHAKKPSPKGIQDAMARAGRTAEETAMLGDKLLTDCLAAKRAGILALTVEPAGGAVTALQKVLHALQAPFKKQSRQKARKK